MDRTVAVADTQWLCSIQRGRWIQHVAFTVMAGGAARRGAIDRQEAYSAADQSRRPIYSRYAFMSRRAITSCTVVQCTTKARPPAAFYGHSLTYPDSLGVATQYHVAAFLPRDAMHSAGLCCRKMSVCGCQTPVVC